MYKIMIAENIPSLNKGELALLKGMIESFNVLDENIEIKIVSSSPEHDQSRYGEKIKIIDVKETFHLKNKFNYSQNEKIIISIYITLKHISFIVLHKILGMKTTKIMKAEVWKEYLASDIIIIGHNGIFGIGSGLIGNFFNFLTFLSYLYLPFFGKTIQKPLVIYASSIPVYQSYIKRKWMSFLLNRIDLITLRESKSLKNLLSLNYIENKAHVTADLAFLMNPDSNERVHKIMELENINDDSILVGITVTRYKAITAYKDLSQSESYEKHSQMLAEVMDFIVENKNAEVIFLPHSIGLEKEFDDRILSEYIFKKCKNKSKIKVIKNEYSPEELKGLMGKFDLFIGERLHSAIGAMSMNVPSIVLSNITDQRLEIIKELGQGSSICYVEDLRKEDLLLKINDMWKKRDKIKKELELQIREAKKKSSGNGKYLKELIS